ncbi:ATP-binding protein [Streptomyces sp. NPDC002845]
MTLMLPELAAPATVQCGEALPAADRPRMADGAAVSFECIGRGYGGSLKPEHAAWVPRLRRIGRAKLRYWGPEELVDPAALVISELVTNALEHGAGTEIGFSISYTPDGLHGVVRIEVDDGSSELPRPGTAGLDEECGRGLLLVEAIASECGGSWGTSNGGTRTWCTLTAPLCGPSATEARDSPPRNHRPESPTVIPAALVPPSRAGSATPGTSPVRCRRSA